MSAPRRLLLPALLGALLGLAGCPGAADLQGDVGTASDGTLDAPGHDQGVVADLGPPRDLTADAGSDAPRPGDLPRRGPAGPAPQTYLISTGLKTDPKRREFASVLDFNAKGPACMSGGERILLRSGQRFYGPLTLKPCAKASGTVTVTTYGGAARATLYGARSIAQLGLSWSKVTKPAFNGKAVTHLQGAPLYRAGPMAAPVQQLYYKGARMFLARAPNPTSKVTAGTQYYTTKAFWEQSPTGCQAPTCVTGDPAQKGVAHLRSHGLGKDTFAVIRTSNWTLQRSKITWVTSDPKKNSFAVADSLRTAANGNKMPTAGHGFILFNALTLLDHKGEWYWDRKDKYLYFWAPDNLQPQAAAALVNHVGAGPLIAADFANRPLDLKVTDLVLERPADIGVKLLQARHLTVERVRVVQPERMGVFTYKLSGKARVANCKVDQPGNTGITIYTTAATEVVDNSVSSPGALHNQPSLQMAFNGVRTGGATPAVTVARNTITSAGYAGVMLGPATASLKVSDNKINGYCQLLNDCGAIYYNGKTNKLKVSQLISGNIMSGSLGNLTGVPKTYVPLAVGVYLDHGTSDFVVRKNTVTASRSRAGGIFLHGGDRNLVEGNVVVASHGAAFGMRKIEPSFPSMSANKVTNNSFTTNSAGHPVIRFIDPSGKKCAGMKGVIAASNKLVNKAAPKLLYECK